MTITLMTKDDVDRLCRVVMASGDLRDISLLAVLAAGVRMKDVLNLRLRDIQLDERGFRLKGERMIGLNVLPGFQESLNEYLQNKLKQHAPDSFAFTSRGSSKRPMTLSTSRVLFGSWLLAAGLNLNLTSHALRAYSLMETYKRQLNSSSS